MPISSKIPAKKSATAPLKSTTKITKNPAVKSTLQPITQSVKKPAVKNLIEKPIKAKKIKLVRDSFTIPKPEYLMLDNLKLRAADLKHPAKKSELLRAGIKALAGMTDQHFLAALKAVPLLKTGRPCK